MAQHHLVRVGSLGHVGRFTSVDATRYPRYARVVLRTGRGLEVGEILAPPAEGFDQGRSEGSILRGMTVEDHLLDARLEKNRQSAMTACTQRISELGIDATLIDVEHLFDGGTLLFYFLGDLTPPLEHVIEELAEIYEAQAQFRRFAETLTEGCGPGCGTDDATGGGCGSCSTACGVASTCAVRRA